MNSHTMFHRLIAGSLLATFAIAALAPAAQAGHGYGQYRKVRGYERPACAGRGGYESRRVVEYRRDGGGSTLAGFLGGLAIGAILTSAAQSHASANVVCERQPVSYAPAPAHCPPPPRDDYGYYSY